jgi:alkanesulfonate monooxygenase SsuD/methylene tetrahydromethanopterin reductase-like flavin-dependent oxidoreductase (luciferase family)
MKVCDFQLFTDRNLSPGWLAENGSAWVTPNSHQWSDPVKRHRQYEDTLEELTLASELGFDGICVNEHHNSLFSANPAPNLFATALSQRTTDTALLVMGNQVAARGEPLRVAEEVAMLDILSEGRVVSGFPVGISMDLNFTLGIPGSKTRARYSEALDLIIKAWTHDGPFVYNGRFNKLRYVSPEPLPYQRPHPPIWLLGGESVDSWERACQNDWPFLFFTFNGANFAKPAIDMYWEAVNDMGRDPNPYRLGYLALLCVGESDAQIERDFKEPILQFYELVQGTPLHFFDPPGYKTDRALQKSDMSQRLMRSIMEYQSTPDSKKWSKIIDEGWVVAGTAESVVQQLEEQAKNLHFGRLTPIFQFASLPSEVARQSLTLFSEQLPRLQSMFADEYEDKWWPSGARRKDPASIEQARRNAR